jgi:predicted metal-dependent phosphoesterase TrpH
MYKTDLHTHSSASPDGGITPAQYQKALESGMLDAMAVTDHNDISVALQLHHDLGDQIIVGEEIMTTHGEIIGLFLTERVPAGLSPQDTVRHIKDQDGLVYIPHPFETYRKGMAPHILEEIADFVDIIEVCNGRAFLQNRSSQAVVWARLNQKDGAASSDAHGFKGLGRTYSDLSEMPTRANLLTILDTAVLRTRNPSFRALLYPKYHRFRKKLGGTK